MTGFRGQEYCVLRLLIVLNILDQLGGTQLRAIQKYPQLRIMGKLCMMCAGVDSFFSRYTGDSSGGGVNE